MKKPTEWVKCKDCDGEGQVESFSDRFDPMAGTHWTVDCKGPCETCQGDGEIEVEKEPVEPLLNDHPDFTQVFWWKPTNPPEFAAKGPFLDDSRSLANRAHVGGQFEILPRPDGKERLCYSAIDIAIMKRWPRVIAAIAAMHILYLEEATIILRNYLAGHNSVVMGFFGKTPTELVESAIAKYFESYKECRDPGFMKDSMEKMARYRRDECQSTTKRVRSKAKGAKP